MVKETKKKCRKM